MRYPVSEGLAVSPYSLGYTEPEQSELHVKHAVTIHHAQFEKASYADERYSMVFRNLISNTYPMLAAEHTLLHETYDPPKPPKDTRVIEVVDEFLAMYGTLLVIRENKTRSHYAIGELEWQAIKSQYRSRVRSRSHVQFSPEERPGKLSKKQLLQLRFLEEAI